MTALVDAPDRTATTATGLLARLATETDEAIASCLNAARESAAALRESAERHADNALHEQVESVTRAHHDARMRERARAEQRVRGSLLTARAAAIERVIEATAAQADALATHPALSEMLRANISQALRYLPEGRVIVQCRPDIADSVRAVAASVGGELITVEPDEHMAFGVIVQSCDGRVEVNTTIARAVSGQRARLDIRIAQLMSELTA